MSNQVAKGIYKNARIVIDASGNLESISEGRPYIPSVGASAATPSRSSGVTYQNGKNLRFVTGYFNAVSGGSVGTITVRMGPSASPGILYTQEFTATVAGGGCPFFINAIPPNYYYSVSRSGDVGASVVQWTEVDLALS